MSTVDTGANGPREPEPSLPYVVTPIRSQLTALVQCPIAGLVAAGFVTALVKWLFPFAFTFYVSVPLALTVFTATTAFTYLAGLKSVPPRKWGAPQILGQFREGWVYGEGDHFMFPFIIRATITPSWAETFAYTVKPDYPEARDKVQVTVGEDRRAVILLRIYDPVRYIQARDRELALEGSFLDLLRKFINQMEYAVGIIDEKSMLDDFLELPSQNYESAYNAFVTRLRSLEVSIEHKKEGDSEEKRSRVFSEDSIRTIVGYMGRFRREAYLLGFYIENIFAPSVDLPANINEAASALQAQRGQNEVLQVRMRAIRSEAKTTKEELGVSGADALDRVGLALDQKVTREVRDERHEYPGLPEVITAGMGVIAEAIKSRGETNNQGKDNGNGK